MLYICQHTFLINSCFRVFCRVFVVVVVVFNLKKFFKLSISYVASFGDLRLWENLLISYKLSNLLSGICSL